VAVANAITERGNEREWRHRELAPRSHVSQAIVRELHHHTVERRRSARTLEALSVALDWHPQHLAAVLRGRAEVSARPHPKSVRSSMPGISARPRTPHRRHRNPVVA
jgi:hypothetical protein